ncbi:MAG: beta-galactosidase, partial [Lentisphaerae bacterium]|nr:beta-galactosidase [Lentisphaerota bacterium]
RTVRFNEPVRTHALRIVIDATADLDHDVLWMAGFHVDGEAADARPLYDAADLSLACDAPTNVCDISAGATVRGRVKNSVGAVADFRLVVDWATLEGRPVKTGDVRRVAVRAGEALDYEASFDPGVQGPYRATVSLYDDARGALLARRRILVGIRDPKLFERGEVEPFDAPGRLPMHWRERIEKHGTIWASEVFHSVAKIGRIAGPQFFRRFKDGGGELVSAYARYQCFEPLPGVYNLDFFDRIVRQAREHDLGLSLGLWWWDFDGPSQYWLQDQRMLGRDGTVGPGAEQMYSLFAPRYTRHACRAVDILLKRYGNTPEVWAWHMHPYGWVDHDAHTIYDYHPAALEAWADWLEARYGTIEALNEAYGMDVSAWDAVGVPEPLWAEAEADNRWKDVVRVLDTRPIWVDWLDFFHSRPLTWRIDMMEKARSVGERRILSGVNASGGVGKADEILAAIERHDGFFGDQGLEGINAFVRRLIADRRYGLPLRLEDHSPLTIGRPKFDTRDDIVARVNLDMFHAAALGVKHFSYVFPVLDDSAAFELLVRNDRTRTLIKEASRTEFVTRPVGLLHSYLTDRLEGRYVFDGISLYRWWSMYGTMAAMTQPGQYAEVFSDGSDLGPLKEMKVVFDDASRVLPAAAVDALVAYVAQGGKLVLLAGSGERIYRGDDNWPLLRRLGYEETQALTERNRSAANLVFMKGNPVLRRMASLPVHFWSALSVPEGGEVVGRIGGQAGAVVWPHGKGRVLLLAGLPGSIPEQDVQWMFVRWRESNKTEYTQVWDVWWNAERELGAIYADLLPDMAEWAGVEPLFELPGDFRAVLRRTEDTRFVYLLNTGPEQTPVLRIDLPDGAYHAEADTLTEATELGRVTADVLRAPGLALPSLPRDRFMAVRLRAAE